LFAGRIFVPVEALIPQKNARIGVSGCFFTSERTTPDSNIPAADLFPNGLWHVGYEKKACFGGPALMGFRQITGKTPVTITAKKISLNAMLIVFFKDTDVH
jgi:hypothetical protein